MNEFGEKLDTLTKLVHFGFHVLQTIAETCVIVVIVIR